MPHPKVKLSDDSGNAVTVTSNRLDVNAYLSATPTIDIGDVSLLLGGTAASTNAGTMDAQTLRVTLATDDTHWGAVGTAADSDGTAHGQLRYIANSTGSLQTELESIDTHFNTQNSYNSASIPTLGTGTYTEGSSMGRTMAAVRNDTLATLANTDNEFAPLQVNASGALYVAGTVDLGSTDNAVLDAMVVDLAAMEALLITIDSDTNAIKTAVEILDNAISGSEMQVDVVASLPAGSAAIGKLAANSGVDIGDVDVTSTVHPAGNGTFNSYAQFTAATTPTALTDSSNGVNGTETAAKEVIIQADFDNSGYLMVGDSGAAADTNGIRLNAGDTIILPIANIANIYIDASASSQTVNVTVIK